MTESRLKFTLRLGRIVFTLAVVSGVTYFIVRTLMRNWENVQQYDITPNAYSLTGLLLFVLSVMVTGMSWGRILQRLSGKQVRSEDAVRVQIASWLLKYVPGQVGSFVGKVGWGTKNGFNKKDITISFMYENILLVTSSLITSVPILMVLFFNKLGANAGRFLPLLVAIPLFIVSTKPVFYRLINFVLKLGKKKPLDEHYFLSFKELLKQQLAFLGPRILIGAGFVLICASIVPVSPSQYLGLGAAYILAGIIGILALFVPSGIGVREGVIILFASAYFPVETATLLALVARFYATAADVLLAVIYVYLTKRSTKQA